MANSIVKIGPPGGPFVEIDEVDGNTVFRVPNDQIDFENVDFTNVANALLSGGNFDGQDTSSLTNLAAVETTTLSGEVVSRPEAIDNLEGNVYLEPDGTDPDTILEEDGDIVFLHEE